MDHIAIMKKSWKLIPKIVNGTKTVESRWYKIKRAPWDKVKRGDTIYFKDSGKSVSVKTTVTRVIQYTVKTNKQAIRIMSSHAKEDLGSKDIPEEVLSYMLDKKYAIFVFFDSVKKIKPFKINKKGFGLLSAWLTTQNISSIKLRNISL